MSAKLPVLGKLPADWDVAPLGELLFGGTRNGIYKPKKHHGSGTKIVNMGELFGNPRLRDIPMRRLELTESEKSRFSLQTGDLLFARRSLVNEGAGKCIIVMDLEEETVFESSIIRARPDGGVADSLFLFYLFNSPFGRYSLGTIRREMAVAGITGADLQKLSLPVPSLPTQKSIAHILGTLDDKIEMNRRMSRTLEAIARVIFKNWFVDFDPVIDNAILNGKPIPDEFAERAEVRRAILARSNGSEGVVDVSPSTFGRGVRGEGAVAYRHLFPDSFQDSSLGKIPKGWEVSTVGNEFDVTMGQSPPGSTYNEKGDGLPFFQGRRDFGFRYPVKRIFCTSPKRIAGTGDTLVSVRAPVGDINMAAEKICVGRGLARVRHRSSSRSFDALSSEPV